MVDFPRCRLTVWGEVDRWADSLSGQVRAAGPLPDTIVALTRGGWVPSRLLADRLGIKRLVALRAQHWGVTATPSGKAELTEGLSGPVRGDSVLVVDDITDTGDSLSLATSHVRDEGAKRVESATCLHLTHSKYRPTYTAEEIPREGWVWVVFPWNYWEDLENLARRAMDEAHDLERAHRILAERCHLKVPIEDVQRVLNGRIGPAK